MSIHTLTSHTRQVVRKFGEGVQLQRLQVAFWSWFMVYGLYVWCAILGERGICYLLVICWVWYYFYNYSIYQGYGARGWLCAYGWVTILRYCLWKNEHISFILTMHSSYSYACLSCHMSYIEVCIY